MDEFKLTHPGNPKEKTSWLFRVLLVCSLMLFSLSLLEIQWYWNKVEHASYKNRLMNGLEMYKSTLRHSEF